MLNLWFLLPVAALLTGLGLHFGVLRAMRGQHRRKQISQPPGDDSASAPGRSLLEQIDRVTIEIKAHRICIFVQPLVLLALVVLYRKFNPGLDLQFTVTSIVACGIVFFFCLWNMIRGSQVRKRYRLSYDADVEVGLALNDLTSQGYHVFHGQAQDNFNIDHIVVGPKGVFTVETRAGSKTSASGRTEDATVTYNGHVLFFPKWTDEETVPHAVDQADLLSKWIGDVTGEPVSARAIVAIPGWLVKRTTSEGVPVVNPSQFPSLFEHIKPRPLTQAQIESIVDPLQRKREDGLDD